MKKIIVVLLSMFLVACSTSGNTTISKDSDGNINVENSNQVNIVEDKTITIPFSFFQAFDENLTKDEIISSLEDDADQNAAVKSTQITDTAIIFTIDGKEYSAFLNEMRDAINESIQEVIDTEEYGITKIEYDQNMTKFIVTINTNQINFYQQLSTILLFVQGAYYQMFAGIDQDAINVVIEFVDVDGNIIDTTSLK